jgi:hypothetical protein
MTTIKRTKGQTTIYTTLHIKAKDQITRSPLKTGGGPRGYGRVSNSCSTSVTRRVALV